MTEHPPAVTPQTAEDRISVASNWQLVWWRFRKHRLALLSALVLLALYAVVLCPDFFSTQDPEATDARLAFIPVQRLHFFDGTRLSPWVPAVVGKRNPTTLRMEWRVDESRKIPVRFFVTGYSYRLLGVVPTRIHLVGAAAADGRDRLYLLGTDRLGRDVFSRVIVGARDILIVAPLATLLGTVLGTALGLIYLALLSRMVRSSMLDVLYQPFIVASRSKGLGERAIVYKHALRNALIPTITIIGISFAILIGGAVVVETIFNIPGVGRLIISAVLRRDYPVIQGVVLCVAGVYMLVNLLIDLSYLLIDPRVRYR